MFTSFISNNNLHELVFNPDKSLVNITVYDGNNSFGIIRFIDNGIIWYADDEDYINKKAQIYCDKVIKNIAFL